MKDGWERVTLETLLHRGWILSHLDGNHGSDYPRKEEFVSHGVPYISANCLNDDRVDMSRAKFLSPSRASLLRKGIAQDNDLLFAHNATVGPVAVLRTDEEKIVLGTSLTYYRCNHSHILPEYLAHYMRSSEFTSQYLQVMGQSTRNQVPITKQREFYHVVPPLADQQRIAAILDEAFEGIATAKANAEKNLQNARALFESHLQSVFTQRGEGWVETTLGSEVDLLAGFAFKSARYTNSDEDVRLLRGDNIIQGCLRWDDVKRWPSDDVQDYDRYELQEGDVVLAMDRPWVKAGLKHATISAEDLPCLLVQRTARLRGTANVNNRFLMYLIGSGAFTGHILGVQTGIGVPHISGQQIKDFEFARPPLAEQSRIADNLESLRFETQRLATIYERKLAALDDLKKSLLHQAFSGNL